MAAGLPPGPAGGAKAPDPLAAIRGRNSKGRGREGRRGREDEVEGKGKGGGRYGRG